MLNQISTVRSVIPPAIQTAQAEHPSVPSETEAERPRTVIPRAQQNNNVATEQTYPTQNEQTESRTTIPINNVSVDIGKTASNTERTPTPIPSAAQVKQQEETMYEIPAQEKPATAMSYGATTDNDGTPVFQTQEGLDAYRKAVDSYTAAITTMKDAYKNPFRDG